MDPHEEVLARRVGQTIAARWTLRKLIGSGGMAAVYAADNPEGQTAAIKILYPEMAMRKDIRERFLREAAVMARIVHPGMVTIFEQGQSEDLAYLAMELLDGETVADRVRRLGRLQATEVLHILDQVLDVLIVAHGMGIVHRDLKPENLFATKAGQVKLLDFGLARLLDVGADSFRTRTGAALGTLPYMAPEQALGRRDEVDARTDLFAVGATAYRLLSGRRIHDAPSEAELLMCMASAPAKPLVMAAPDLSPNLGAVIDRALAFAKAARYPDAATMQRDVRALLRGQVPEYALWMRERDETATKVDRQAPKVASTAQLPNSARPLQPPIAGDGAAVTTPTSQPLQADHRAQSPAGSEALKAEELPLAPLATRAILPPTVVMPISRRDALTLPDPVIAVPTAGASIPSAPVSDVVLERKRRRTLWIGLGLFWGMLGVATAAAWYLLRATDSTQSRSGTPVQSNMPPASRSPESKQPAPPTPGETKPAHMRHPAHVMTPEDEPAITQQPRHELRNTSPRASKVPAPPFTSTDADTQQLLPQLAAVTAAAAVAVTSPTASSTSPAPGPSGSPAKEKGRGRRKR